jgi:hypothetical protein
MEFVFANSHFGIFRISDMIIITNHKIYYKEDNDDFFQVQSHGVFYECELFMVIHALFRI